MSEILCKICNRIVFPAQFSKRIDMCHDCRDDEVVVQLAIVFQQTKTLAESFAEWGDAFNRWAAGNAEATKLARAATASLMPVVMQMREDMGIEADDPRTEGDTP